MSIDDIKKEVRWCIDEEATNGASFNTVTDDVPLMNNIIEHRIKDALRWVCLYAPADLLGGTDEPPTTSGQTTTPHPTGIMVDATPSPTAITGTSACYFTLPADFIKLARVRVEGWHRAVRVPITEDSDEYLQLYDENGATATYDRPQAALIEKAVRELEVWPCEASEAVHVTYISSYVPEEFSVSEGEPAVTTYHIALPPRVKTSFIYYLAYLLCSAYGDPRADRMLDIAKQNLGK